MAAEQPTSLSSGLGLTDCEWARVSPITITKNESQEYVISRPTRSAQSTRPESNYGEMVSSVPNSSYTGSSCYTNSTMSNYQPFVRSTIVSESYRSIGNSQMNEVNSCSSSMNHYPPTSVFSYHRPNSADNPGHSLSHPKVVGSACTDFVNSNYSGIVPTVANYQATSSIPSSKSRCTANLTSYLPNASTISYAYQKGQTFNDLGPSTSHLNLSNSSSRRGTPDGLTALSSTIPLVDLTDSQNSGSSNHQWMNMISSVPNGGYQNGVACSSVTSGNVLFSSQISSTVTERTTANSSVLGDPNTNGYKLSADSRQRISNILSEISKLMKNTCAIRYFNEYKESHIQAQRDGKNENSVEYNVIELYRFNMCCDSKKPSSELIPTAGKLLLMCKTYFQKYVSIMFREEDISLQDEILIHNIKLFFINLNRLFSANYMTGNVVQKESSSSSVLTTAPFYPTTAIDEVVCGRRNKDKIYKYEQHIEWQKAKISLLENKLNEKNDEIEKSQKKCEELEEKLRRKDAIGCWRQDNMTEWCCELMSELKINMLDLMENEFKCCICDELLIEPGVTNCNHIFCIVCLNTWRTKKKECPVCRANIVNVFKVNPIDEFITAATSSISDKAYAERLQVIEDRKNSNPPPAKKPYVGLCTISTSASPTSVPLSLSLPPSNIPFPPPNVPTSFSNASIPVSTSRIPPPAHSSASWSSSSHYQHQPHPQQQQTPTYFQRRPDFLWDWPNLPSFSSSTRQPNSSWTRVTPVTSRSASYVGPVPSDSS